MVESGDIFMKVLNHCGLVSGRIGNQIDIAQAWDIGNFKEAQGLLGAGKPVYVRQYGDSGIFK